MPLDSDAATAQYAAAAETFKRYGSEIRRLFDALRFRDRLKRPEKGNRMQTIYLVKKDPEAPMNRRNWKIMNSGEFSQFQMTREGQRRISAFAPIDPYGRCEPCIVAECGAFQANRWQLEKERFERMESMRRLREMQSAQLRRRTVTMKRDLEEGLEPGNPHTDIEHSIIWKEQKELLNEGLRRLTEEQRQVLSALYLRNPGMTEEKVAEELGIARSVVNSRKRIALGKMRKFLIQHGETIPTRPGRKTTIKSSLRGKISPQTAE